MKLTSLFYLLLIILAGSSCTRYYYKPNAVNAPLFTDGGQAHLNLAGSVGGVNEENNGNTYFFDVQGSVSPVNHLGIIANYSTYAYRPDEPDVTSGNVDGDAHLLEAGIGGYYAKGNRFKFVVDGYVGYGGGSIRSDVDMKLNRFFFQPGIGVRSPGFDAVFNLRISNVKYRDLNAKGRSNDYLRENELIDASGRRIDGRSYTFMEPAFTIRAGYKFAKAQFQMALAQEFTRVQWHYNAVRFTAGFYFSLEDAIEAGKK